MLPTDFWEQLRAEVAKAKPDLIMLAEASKPELLTNAFDIDYSWPLLSTVSGVLTGNAPASDIRHSWEESCAKFPKAALHMRISDDHDEDRAIARYGLNGALAASALMFTLDGVPLIYNGMEAGDATSSSGDALFDKRNIVWHPKDHPELRGIYHDLIQLRHQYAALRSPTVDWLHNSDETNLVTFLRADEKDELLVVINLSDHPLTGEVNMKSVDSFVPLKITGVQNSSDGPLPTIRLGQYEWRIYHRASIPGHPAQGIAVSGN
jgi:hypothetical protein